jgi:hypothetical protein
MAGLCHHAGIKEIWVKISPATVDRALKKDKNAIRLKGKSLIKLGYILKCRIPPIRFFQLDTAGL